MIVKENVFVSKWRMRRKDRVVPDRWIHYRSVSRYICVTASVRVCVCVCVC